LEAKRVPLLENLVKNISCLAITLVAVGRLLAAIVGSPQKTSSAVAPQRFSQRRRAATAVDISFSKSHCLTTYKAVTLKFQLLSIQLTSGAFETDRSVMAIYQQ
jgi:hypothetical protein